MDSEAKLLKIHEFYNLSRYLFLNIEWNYNNFIEKTDLTLPQLRVLWIIKLFQGISLTEISKIGCWSPPTVTNMIKLLLKNGLVEREVTSNKKEYALSLTKKGNNIIKKNQLKKGDNSSLFFLLCSAKEEDLTFTIDILKSIAIRFNNTYIFEYIEKINTLGLKIDFRGFNLEEKTKLKELTCFYNLLRIFILSIENNHRNLLSSFNITYPQLRCLWILNAFPGLNSLKLSEISYLAPSTENVIVKNLYEKELIYKEKSPVKNSLFLYNSKLGEELLIKEFEVHQKNLLIYKNVDFLNENELSKLNEFLYKLNLALGNDFVKDYIDKTSSVIKQRLLKQC